VRICNHKRFLSLEMGNIFAITVKSPIEIVRIEVFNRAYTNHDMRWVQEVATSGEKRDNHFSLIAHDSPFRRLFNNSNKFRPYVIDGQAVADLGCYAGYYTLVLAECVGPEGRVYAVDSDEKAIRALEKKADKRGYHNIEAHVSSAFDLSFKRDEPVDFVLANGLLCSMAPQHHESVFS